MQYLLYGKFLNPPDIVSPVEEFVISRLSIYAGKTGNTITTFRDTFQLIYSGMWQSENKGIGIALASISDEPFRVNVTLNAGDYGLPQSGKVFRIDAEGKRLLNFWSNQNIHIDFTLQSRGLSLLEVIPDK